MENQLTEVDMNQRLPSLIEIDDAGGDQGIHVPFCYAIEKKRQNLIWCHGETTQYITQHVPSLTVGKLTFIFRMRKPAVGRHVNNAHGHMLPRNKEKQCSLKWRQLWDFVSASSTKVQQKCDRGLLVVVMFVAVWIACCWRTDDQKGGAEIKLSDAGQYHFTVECLESLENSQHWLKSPFAGCNKASPQHNQTTSMVQ